MQKTSGARLLKLLTIALLLIVCGYSMSFNILSNTMDPLVKEFSLTGASQGLMSSMINFGSLLPLLIIPLLQGRVHKIWLILGASILQVLMLLLTGASGSFGMLLFSCVLLGAGNNTTDSCVNSYMVDLHPENSAGVLGLLHGCYGIGGLLTPILVSAILASSGAAQAPPGPQRRRPCPPPCSKAMCALPGICCSWPPRPSMPPASWAC